MVEKQALQYLKIQFKKKLYSESDMVACVYNLSSGEAEAEDLVGHPRLHSGFQSSLGYTVSCHLKTDFFFLLI